MKVTVIGAGSTYTPELVEGLLALRDVLPVAELTLHDTDVDRLEILAGLAQRMVSAAGSGLRVVSTTDLAAAVAGASFVLLQLRVGQQAARLLDETLPHRFDLLGQETTGAGGFGKALRTVPVVRAIAEQVRSHAPEAWILDFTNPVGIITRALLDDGHRAIGLCNVAISFQRLFAGLFGVSPDAVELGHAGLNHLTWIRSVRVDGQERIDDLLQTPLRDEVAAEIGLNPVALDVLGAIPSYYLKYFYAARATLQEQRVHVRAEEVKDLERRLLAMYADPSLAHKPELLAERGGAHYSEAAGKLMTSLHTDDGALHYVNIRNDGVIRGLHADAVVEVPARVGRQGATAVGVPDLPPEVLTLVQTVSAYEALTLDAARDGERGTALRALVAHPLIREPELASGYLEALLQADRGHLPAFFPTV